jgi:hypothetical protein
MAVMMGWSGCTGRDGEQQAKGCVGRSERHGDAGGSHWT